MKKAVLIYADFMKDDDDGRLILTCYGTHADLTENNIILKEGMKLVFYTDDGDNNGNQDDLVIEGIVGYDKENDRWTAKINWDDIKNVSQLSLEEKKIIGIE